MVTGDAHINAGAPVVCCTAEILANQALREGEGADVGCVAMDEFHFYGDYDRGWAWQVPLLTLPKAQFSAHERHAGRRERPLRRRSRSARARTWT